MMRALQIVKHKHIEKSLTGNGVDLSLHMGSKCTLPPSTYTKAANCTCTAQLFYHFDAEAKPAATSTF